MWSSWLEHRTFIDTESSPHMTLLLQNNYNCIYSPDCYKDFKMSPSPDSRNNFLTLIKGSMLNFKSTYQIRLKKNHKFVVSFCSHHISKTKYFGILHKKYKEKIKLTRASCCTILYQRWLLFSKNYHWVESIWKV